MTADDDKAMLSLQVPRTLMDELDRIAASTQLSRSDVARRALTLNLDGVERSLSATEADAACLHCPKHCSAHEGVQP
jgi:hypothetical protein